MPRKPKRPATLELGPAAGLKGVPPRLESLRRNSGLSVLAFAQHCGIANSAMRDYLSGRFLPGPENLVSIAAANGVTVDWLLTGDDSGSLDEEALRIVTAEVLRAKVFGDQSADVATRNATTAAKLIVTMYYTAITRTSFGRLSPEQLHGLAAAIREALDESVHAGEKRKR